MNEENLIELISQIRKQSNTKYFGAMEISGYRIEVTRCTSLTQDIVDFRYFKKQFTCLDHTWYLLGNFDYGTIVSCLEKNVEYLIKRI